MPTDTIAARVVRVMHGDTTFETGPYTLSYNDDSEGYWWLTTDAGLSIRFAAVERAGQGYFLVSPSDTSDVTINPSAPKAASFLGLLADAGVATDG